MTNSLEVFFTGKYFRIPSYQRDYAWNIQNIDELFDDILEAMETNVGYYIGTFILSQNKEQNFYDVVDGQQRLTTLTMILNSIIEKLSSDTDKIMNKERFILSNYSNKWKLELLGDNNDFFKQLLDGQSVTSINKSQKLLKRAYNYIQWRVQAIKNSNKENEFLEFVKQLLLVKYIIITMI